MLSIVDLLKDGTLTREMAGLLTFLMLHDLSFLTGANPSGTGKTTLMASLLNLQRPGVKIKTVTPENLDESGIHGVSDGPERTKFLVHEIGKGSYFSYLWGDEAKNFLDLPRETSSSIASCIHADTLKELKGTLRSEIGLRREAMNQIDLLLFMKMKGGYENRIRRVSHVYEFSHREDEHRLIYKWNETSDEFDRIGKSHIAQEIAKRKNLDVEVEVKKYSNFLGNLEKKGVREIEEVRKRLLSFIK
ncbi:MAG: hypothetical protein ACOCTL_03070 [Candidatus Hadarchaeota archaeon]